MEEPMIAGKVGTIGPAPPAGRLHEHLGRLLKRAWRDYRRSFRRCRRKFSEDSVHRLRVESRRLLALLALLGTLVGAPRIAPPCRLVKKELRRLARLRDTQVQLAHVEGKVPAFPELRPFQKVLRGRERRLIRRVGGRMHRARMGRITSAMADVQQTVAHLLADQPHELDHWQALWHSVDQAFASVVERRMACCAGAPETIHRLRIAFKRFRYMLELLQPVLPGVTQRQLDALHGFQTRLGEIQDAEVLVLALDKFARKRPGAGGALRAFQRDAERCRRGLVRQLLARTGRIRGFWPPPVSRRVGAFRADLTAARSASPGFCRPGTNRRQGSHAPQPEEAQ
jgi:CHAD domain-containing protein